MLGSDVRIVDETTESSLGSVFIDVTVENTAEEPRVATIEAKVDASGSGELFKTKTVSLDSGEQRSLTFMFSSVIPPGDSSTAYNSDGTVKAVESPGDGNSGS